MSGLSHRIAASAVLSLASIAPAVAQPADERSCPQLLEPALQQLIDLPPAQWRFVLLDEPQSEHFIQYAWWGGLTVDLPLVALDAEQQARAQREFERVGGGPPIPVVGPDGTVLASERTFQHDFGRDSAAAARFGCEALRKIFGLDQALPLEVSVGGD